MPKRKPYKAKSINGAERRVRELVKQLEQANLVLERFAHERFLLANLAATGPAFFNPLEAMAAEKIRDKLLEQANMNPDGSFKSSVKAIDDKQKDDQ